MLAEYSVDLQRFSKQHSACHSSWRGLPQAQSGRRGQVEFPRRLHSNYVPLSRAVCNSPRQTVKACEDSFTVAFTLWLTTKVFELTATFFGALVFVYGYGPRS